MSATMRARFTRARKTVLTSHPASGNVAEVEDDCSAADFLICLDYGFNVYADAPATAEAWATTFANRAVPEWRIKTGALGGK